MKKIIDLRPSSSADEIQCPDGELENADFMFPDSAASESGSGGNGGNSSSPDFTNLLVNLSNSRSLPPGSDFLAVHSPSPGVRNIIIRTSDGHAAWLGDTIINFPPVKPLKAVGVKEWLVFLTEEGLFYALWNGEDYVYCGSSPRPPESEYRLQTKAIPPYSNADGESPRLTVSVSIGNDSENDVLGWLAGRGNPCSASTRSNIISTVTEKLKEFLKNVRLAGFFFSPVNVSSAWVLKDGSLWLRSEWQQLSLPGVEDSGITLAVESAECSAGQLYISLKLSHSPFVPVCKAIDVPSNWTHLIHGVEHIVESPPADDEKVSVSTPVWLSTGVRGFTTNLDHLSSQPAENKNLIYSAMEEGAPENIFSIGGRLLATRGGSIFTSKNALPMVCTGASEIAGEGVLHLTQSLRALSSGQFGQFPLYAFCRDGIRALTPDNGSFRDVQLISRDVPLSKDCFAPLPDSTCFITRSGVMKIEGTSVSCISKSLETDFVASQRLLYLYKENALILYGPSSDRSHIYFLNTGKWFSMSSSVASHHYAWPETYVLADNKLGAAYLRAPSPVAPLSASGGELYPFKTRSIKLGAAFDYKQLSLVEVIWPDGSRQPLKLYGAVKPGKWYFLGLAPGGRMTLRGSGWRFFRIESFAVKSNDRYFLPRILMVYRQSF